ncbi:MAG: DHH family phosphoesterase [Thermodesulfobacteriota bacterium]|nr:DHH family phosphoesterase [Thermodesulfobacteriota bacterium]
MTDPNEYKNQGRRKLKELYRTASDTKHPLVLIFGNPDPDALASAWAMKELLGATDITASIRYTGEVTRLENETLIHSLRIPVLPLEKNNLYDADLIILVDCQPDFFKDIEIPRCDIIIDHHPRKSYRVFPFIDIRPNCLASSSILTQYIHANDIKINKRLATALYYGIQTDSRNSQSRPSSIDLEAIQFLERKIDRTLLRRIEFSSYSLSFLDYFSIALIRLRFSNNILYSHMGPIPSSDVCVQVADFLIRVKEAKWTVVSGVTGKKLIVVFRCDGNKKHAGKTAQAAFGKSGSAGGHRTMARAEIDENKLPIDMALTQNEKLERFILESLSKTERGFKFLLRYL